MRLLPTGIQAVGWLGACVEVRHGFGTFCVRRAVDGRVKPDHDVPSYCAWEFTLRISAVGPGARLCFG